LKRPAANYRSRVRASGLARYGTRARCARRDTRTTMRRCRHSPDVRPWEITQQNWKVLAVRTDEISFGPAHDRQLTAENLTVEAANGVGYAYRRFGNTGTASPPLVFLQHFRGNLDNWDPCLVDEIAVEREVILFDNAGVGLSSGAVPNTVSQMARDAIAFLD